MVNMITKIREDHDLSKEKLASLIHMSKNTLRKYEDGDREINDDLLIKINDALNTNYTITDQSDNIDQLDNVDEVMIEDQVVEILDRPVDLDDAISDNSTTNSNNSVTIATYYEVDQSTFERSPCFRCRSNTKNNECTKYLISPILMCDRLNEFLF